MFIGHYAMAFAAKKTAPQISLGTFFLAVLWLDLIWPVFLFFGIERARITPGITKLMPLDLEFYPFTHSLLGTIVWAVLFALVYFCLKGKLKHALLLGGCVISHWLLDALVHRRDLPLSFANEHKVGFGLWDSALGTFLIEAPLFVLGIFLYLKSTRARDHAGKIGHWVLVVLLSLIYSGQYLGVTPPSMSAVIAGGMSQWLFVAWGYWLDRHREAVL